MFSNKKDKVFESALPLSAALYISMIAVYVFEIGAKQYLYSRKQFYPILSGANDFTGYLNFENGYTLSEISWTYLRARSSGDPCHAIVTLVQRVRTLNTVMLSGSSGRSRKRRSVLIASCKR